MISGGHLEFKPAARICLQPFHRRAFELKSGKIRQFGTRAPNEPRRDFHAPRNLDFRQLAGGGMPAVTPKPTLFNRQPAGRTERGRPTPAPLPCDWRPDQLYPNKTSPAGGFAEMPPPPAHQLDS